MNRTAYWVIMGPLAVIAAMCYVGLVHEVEPPPTWFVFVYCTLLALTVATASFRLVKSRLAKQRALEAFASISDDEALALRLSGDYAPFVIESAQELGALKSPAA